jgi:hypothetical protein
VQRTPPPPLPTTLALLALIAASPVLLHCNGWNQVAPEPTNDWGDDDTETPAPQGVWHPEVTDELLRNPDAGWVASNPNQDWVSLEERAGGEPFRPASVIYVRGSAAEWCEPADGSDPGDAGAGELATRLSEAISHGRYAAFRIYADSLEDLPSGWPTTTEPASALGDLPDGLVRLIDVAAGPPGSGDDDDSAGDDDSAAGDDDSAGPEDPPHSPVWVPDWSDPDYRSYHGELVRALGERFAGEPGIAFVDVGGVGTLGSWDLGDEGPWFLGDPPRFTEASWVAMLTLYADLYEGWFPDTPLYVGWAALASAGVARPEAEAGLLDNGVHVRDDCMGGCAAPDFDRFPDEGSGNPYPADDPYGGWLPAELWEDFSIQYEGGLGGIGNWRLLDQQGTWDEGSWGDFSSYFERMMDVHIHYAPPSLVSLAASACVSEWVVAATPPAAACGSHTPGEIWSPLLSYGRQLGYRYVVSEVRATPDWDIADPLPVEIDVRNDGVARAFEDRDVEFGLSRASDGEIVGVPALGTPDAPTSQWLPGETHTVSAEIPTSAVEFDDDEPLRLWVRFVDEGAFGGGIQLPHPGRTADARHFVAHWPASAE